MESSPGSVTWPHHRLPEFSSLLKPESRAMAKPSPANRTPKDSLSPGEGTQGKEAACTPSMLPAEGAATMRQLYMGESRSSTSSSLSDSLSDFYTSSPDLREGAKGKEQDKECLRSKRDDGQGDSSDRATQSQPSDDSSSERMRRQATSSLQLQGDVYTENGGASTHTGLLGHPPARGITEASALRTDSATDSEETESEREFTAEGAKVDVDGKKIISHSKDQLTLQMTPDSVEPETPESPLVKDAANIENLSSDVSVASDKVYSGTFSVYRADSSLQDFTQADFVDRMRARVRVGSPDWSLGLCVSDMRCNTPRPLLDGSEAFPNVERSNNPSESHDTLHTPPLTMNRSPNTMIAVTEQLRQSHQEFSAMPSMPVPCSVIATQSDSSQTTLIGGIVAGGKTPEDITSWYRKLPPLPQHIEPMIPDLNKTTGTNHISYPCPEMDPAMIQDGTSSLMWNQSPELTNEGAALLESSQQEARTSFNKSNSAWKFTYTHPWDFSPRKRDDTLPEYGAKPSSGVSSALATEEHLVRMTGQVPAKSSADVTQQTWSAGTMMNTATSSTLPSAMPPAVSVSISQPTHNNLNLLTQAAQEQAETLSSILPGQQFLVYLVPGPPDAAGTPGPPTLLYVPHTPGMAAPVIRKDIMQHGQIQGIGNNKGINNNKSGYLFIPVRPDPLSSAQYQTGYIRQPYTNPSHSGDSFQQVQKTFHDPTAQLCNTGELPAVSTPFPVIQGGAAGELSHSCPVYNAIPTSSTYSSYMTTAPMRGNSGGLLRKPRGLPASSSHNTQSGNTAQANNANSVSVRYNMIGCFTESGVTVPNTSTQSTGGLFTSRSGSVRSAAGTSSNRYYPAVESTSVPGASRLPAAEQVNWRQMYPGHLQPTPGKSTSLLRQHLQQAALGKPQASASISSLSGLESLENSLSVNNSCSTVTGSQVASSSSVQDSSMLSQSGMTLLTDAGTGAISQANPAVQTTERKPTTTLNAVEIAQPTGVRSEVAESTTGHISTPSKQKVDPRMYPPRHYEFRVIQVGTWKVEHKGSDVGQTAKIKLLFASRKLVYEFQLNSVVRAHNMGMRQLASVEIPFKIIVGINAQLDKITLEVSEAPMMYFGTRVCPRGGETMWGRAARYRRDQRADITGGQLQTIPYHTIELRSMSAVRKVQECLEKFDPGFVTMMRTPMAVDPNKRLAVKQESRPVPVVTQPPSYPLKPRGEGQEGDVVGPPAKRYHPSDSCSCSTGCSSRRCGCWSCMRPCEPSCSCTNCNNPLMILKQFGVDADKALEDDCLVVNFAKVSNLRQHLQTLYHLPCCGAMVQLLDMIPGYRTCPECKHKAVYAYSWCNFDLCDQNKRPRNHCTKCRKCKDFRDVHCQKCNTCYFAGALGEQRCPCTLRQRPSHQTTSTEGLSGFFQFFVGNQQQLAAQGSGFDLNQPVPSGSNQHGTGSGV
ncbi:PREDICTED: uncharacterized protein LOC109482799 [Branchiostoma belcheri]|uniref:Uncharacterized protein LOC109482799 n=1 Tax=Branchiostoma belcheri TaxID=7741 RepID=A0A6P4ZWA5_BRABE|nr:PREDICTED: uncharacterized protein LOC109482799 [Branchiostoma belcheri]